MGQPKEVDSEISIIIQSVIFAAGLSFLSFAFVSGSAAIVIFIVVGFATYGLFNFGKSVEMKEESNRENHRLELEQEYERLRAAALEIAASHIGTLKKKYGAGVFKDEYGVLRRNDWENTVSKYFNEVVLPSLNLDNFYKAFWQVYSMEDHGDRFDDKYETDLEERHHHLHSLIDALSSVIDAYVSSLIDGNDRLPESLSGAAKGEEFEYECMNLLQENGWSVDMTPKSGDQGVDLLARKNSLLVAVQCKNYSNKIGNSAVQEIVAGKEHYHADYAVVVSASGFTKPARELAESNGVVLLHIEDLPSLEGILD